MTVRTIRTQGHIAHRRLAERVLNAMRDRDILLPGLNHYWTDKEMQAALVRGERRPSLDAVRRVFSMLHNCGWVAELRQNGRASIALRFEKLFLTSWECCELHPYEEAKHGPGSTRNLPAFPTYGWVLCHLENQR
jgi:hypothetical protein